MDNADIQSNNNDPNGYIVTDSPYKMRPEIVESIFYMFRLTRNSMYREWAWDIFQVSTAMFRKKNTLYFRLLK